MIGIFSSERFGENADIAGSLVIRTGGNLTINNSLTDGQSQTGDSWSFQLVAGADETSADTFATNAEKDLDYRLWC